MDAPFFVAHSIADIETLVDKKIDLNIIRLLRGSCPTLNTVSHFKVQMTVNISQEISKTTKNMHSIKAKGKKEWRSGILPGSNREKTHYKQLLHAFFRRDTFIRDRKLSTGILGKNKRCSVLKFLDVRDEPDNLTVYSAKKIVNSKKFHECTLCTTTMHTDRFFRANVCHYFYKKK